MWITGSGYLLIKNCTLFNKNNNNEAVCNIYLLLFMTFRLNCSYYTKEISVTEWQSVQTSAQRAAYKDNVNIAVNLLANSPDVMLALLKQEA